MGFDKILELGNSGVELSDLGDVIGFPLFNCFEQGFGDALQGVGVEVGAAVQNVSG